MCKLTDRPRAGMQADRNETLVQYSVEVTYIRGAFNM